ncbi:uncharacterized protein LOC135644634 isoform X2 [Musa acuminata AAA Group]|uniref:uncharacterized protein LOC135644634 isoform X2 n=1 Tax=Musa acuminata AAA Group TaxID=214697 RepID=UPI0031E3711B
MPNDEGGIAEQKRCEGVSEPVLDSTPTRNGDEIRGAVIVSQEDPVDGSMPPLALSITIFQPEEVSKPNMSASKSTASEGGEKISGMAALKKGFLSRSGSYQEQCRCRGDLAKAHRSCIDTWFLTKGSNKCEICQQIAANVPFPESRPSVNNCLWRINSPYVMGQEHERGCFNPLWVAFAILIGGLLLDVLVSVSLGVSALPANIIIGVLIVLGLGTSFRLALECCQGQGARRNLQTTNVTFNPGYHPTV